ncbi:MAG TPA: DJ-1/PfpI family protein [Thermoanaerobaculia bacterium]|nr:DJ-1/PfpI family protein [Thermoanaerobaculia bacterium]
MTNSTALATLATLAALAVSPAEASIPRYEARQGRARPVIVVLGDNKATETTDYVVPYGILAESDVAEVIALSTEPGPIQMRPALRFRVHATIDEFDARFPSGADYVVVPNIYEGSEKATVLDWVRSQARTGATIVGICDGVPVLANAGLLDGRTATAHWRTIDGLERKHPRTRWVRNRRYVADGNIITTSGVSASIPISIALVEAIGGRRRAEALAQTLGVTNWSPVHDSSQFQLGSKLVTGLLNKGTIWRHETLGIDVLPGVDEIALALVADSYSRTRRSWAYSVAPSLAPIRTRRGLILLPDRLADRGEVDAMLPAPERDRPALALDRALEGIEARYGEPTAELVAVQIEYPWRR